MQATIIDRILELWGIALPDQSGYEQKNGVTAPMVWSALEREFGAEEVRRALADYLIAHGQLHSAKITTKIQRSEFFLVHCCFELCQPVEARRLDFATVKQLLWTLPAVGFSHSLAPWVTYYFDQATLLHVMAEGIRAGLMEGMRSSCAYGLGVYRLRSQPSASKAFYEGLLDFAAALRTQTGDVDALSLDSTDYALTIIWKQYRKWPEWPRTTAADLRAYRHENGASVTYTVERITDGYVVLQIPKFERVGRVATLEYRNQEPSLLPEDVPSILEATLFKTYFSERDFASIDQIRFVDLRLKQVVEKPVPGRA